MQLSIRNSNLLIVFCEWELHYENNDLWFNRNSINLMTSNYDFVKGSMSVCTSVHGAGFSSFTQ